MFKGMLYANPRKFQTGRTHLHRKEVFELHFFRGFLLQDVARRFPLSILMFCKMILESQVEQHSLGWVENWIISATQGPRCSLFKESRVSFATSQSQIQHMPYVMTSPETSRIRIKSLIAWHPKGSPNLEYLMFGLSSFTI